MNLLKSVGAGILCVVLMFVALLLGAVAFMFAVSATSTSTATIGWDPGAFVRSPGSWAVILSSFAFGFVWEYRRLTRR